MSVQSNDVIEVSARMEYIGVDDVMNVYQFRYDGVAVANDSDVVADLGAYLEQIYTNLVTSQPTNFVYRDINYKNVTQGLLMGTFSWPTFTTGQTGTDNVPPGICALINFATNKARVILKKYFGGLPLIGLEGDGTWTSGTVNLLINIGIQLLAGYVQGVRSYTYGHDSPKTLGFEVPNGYTVTDIPAYQRRRKQGRGA